MSTNFKLKIFDSNKEKFKDSNAMDLAVLSIGIGAVTVVEESGDLDFGAASLITSGNVDGRDVSADGTTLDNHVANTSNPHSVTKAQVGLGNVDNVQQLPMSYLDTDTSLTANSDAKVASQKAVKAYIAAQVGATGAFSDSAFRIQDNADATKQMAFEVSAIATGTTRTITMPDAAVNLGLIATAIQSTEKGTNSGVATLDSGGKIPVAQLPNSVMEFKGNYNATTNSPTLADGTGNAGDVYRVNVAGSQDFGSGSITFVVGDWVVYNGSVWQQSHAGADAVLSVNGAAGVVVLTTSDIAEGSNLYFTNSRFDTRFNTDFAAKSTADLAEGSNLYYTDERAQDAIGAMVANSSKVSLTYVDGTPSLTADIVAGSLVNADISASAAIAYSKLALTGAILNADLAGSIAYSKLSLTGSIVNADISSSAAIAYSKLALTGAILNADLAGSIAYSKLSLGGSIVNSDISSSAAIAYSKLNLTGAILNADLAGSIAYSKLSLTNSIVAGDLTAVSVTNAKINTNVFDQTTIVGGAGTAASVSYVVAKTNDNAGTITVRQVVYIKSNGNVDLARADVANLGDGALGIVSDATIATTASGNIVVRRGCIVPGFSGMTPGKKQFVSKATAGALVETVSFSSSGDSVYSVGRAISATELLFDPQFEFEFA